MRWLLVLSLASCFIEPPRPPNDGIDADLGDTVNYVFVTSKPVVPGMLGGATGADTACSDAATEAGVSGIFKAWISTSSEDAIDRLGSASGWQRRDHLLFADRPSDLALGHELYPPRLDEHGTQLPDDVMIVTGTNQVARRIDGQMCSDYTTTTGMVEYGLADGGVGYWSAAGTTSCATPLHVLCLGTDKATVIPALAAPHPWGFHSANPFYIESGRSIADADAFCQHAAEMKGLGGTYRALLATTTASARSRFDPSKGPWRRLDGVAFTTDLMSFDAPLDETEAAQYAANVMLFGAPDLGSLANSSCNDWSEPNAATIRGVSARSSSAAFSYGLADDCSLSTHLYCLEVLP